jgi:hypothetical protein
MGNRLCRSKKKKQEGKPAGQAFLLFLLRVNEFLSLAADTG